MPLQLKPFLLIGLDASQLWPLTNLVLPAWLLLAFAPTWRHTAKLALIPPLVHSLLYALCVLSVFGEPSGDPPDFGSLEGVIKLFQDPNGALPIVMHHPELPSHHQTLQTAQASSPVGSTISSSTYLSAAGSFRIRRRAESPSSSMC